MSPIQDISKESIYDSFRRKLIFEVERCTVIQRTDINNYIIRLTAAFDIALRKEFDLLWDQGFRRKHLQSKDPEPKSRFELHKENAFAVQQTKYKDVLISSFVNESPLLDDQVIISVFVKWPTGLYVGMKEDLNLEPDGLYQVTTEFAPGKYAYINILTEAIKTAINDYRKVSQEYAER